MSESLLQNVEVNRKQSHAYTVNELQKENTKKKKSGWNKVKTWNTKHRYKMILGEDQEIIKSGYYFMIWCHCENMVSRDIITPSDPIALLYIKDHNTGMYYELGRSEILRDTNNPIFHTPFLVNKAHLRMEKPVDEVENKQVDINEVSPFDKVLEPENQDNGCLDSPIGRFLYSLLWGKLEIKEVENKNNNLKLVVVDVDDDQYIFNKQIVGTTEFNLETLLEDDSNNLVAKLHLGEKKVGKTNLIAEAVLNEKYLNAECLIRIGASGVERKGALYPFLVISRQINNLKGNWFPVYRTEIVNEYNSSEPFWQDIIIKYLFLCNGEEDTLLKFELFHFNTLNSLPSKLSRPHELLSSIQLRVSDLNRIKIHLKM
eukprot:gene7421-11744_t